MRASGAGRTRAKTVTECLAVWEIVANRALEVYVPIVMTGPVAHWGTSHSCRSLMNLVVLLIGISSMLYLYPELIAVDK